MEYLPVQKDNLKSKPYRFLIEIEGVQLIFEFRYNQIDENIYFDVLDVDENPIIIARKLVYSVDLFSNVIDNRLPEVVILPLDANERVDKITLDNFMDRVIPYIASESDL